MPDETVEETTRDISEEPEEGESVELSTGRNIIAAIGIDNYAHHLPLTNAVSDAQAVLGLFKRCGFEELPGAPSLFDEQATLGALTSLVRDQLNELQPDDSLVLYYAGHGTTVSRDVPNPEDASKRITHRTGYLIPVEARELRSGDWLRLDAFLDDVALLPARHVLVILDACKSGFALSDKFKFRGAGQAEGTIAELSGRVSRRVITSAMHDQKAMDGGGSGNSLFTETLVDAVENLQADWDGDGYITTTDLFNFVRNRVSDRADKLFSVKQTPDYGYLPGDGSGELVLALRRGAFNRLIQSALEAMLHHDVPHLEGMVAQLVAANPDYPVTLYLQSRLKFMQGDFDGASDILQGLDAPIIQEGYTLPTKPELNELRINLRYFKPLLLLPPGNPPIEVSMLAGPDEKGLSAAPKEGFWFGDVYQLQGSSVATFEVRNTSDKKAYLYHVKVLPYGQLHIGSFLLPESATAGLAPGAVQRLRPFKVSEPLHGPARGITQVRVLYSRKPIADLASPAPLGTQEVFKVISGPRIDKLVMTSVWYQRFHDTPLTAMDAAASPDTAQAYLGSEVS